MDHICPYLKAAYPLLFIETVEEERAISQLMSAMSRDDKLQDAYTVKVWDVFRGTHEYGEEVPRNANPGSDRPIQALFDLLAAPAGTIFIVKDYHRYLAQAVDMYRTLLGMLPRFKKERKHLILVGPSAANLPPEIKTHVSIIPFSLPDAGQLLACAQALMDEVVADIEREGLKVEDKLTSTAVDESVISAGCGLTEHEVENACARSLAEHGEYRREVLDEEKLQMIRRTGYLEIFDAAKMNEVGGLEELKAYAESRKKGLNNPDLPQPKGILLIGPSGTGKTLAAKAIAEVFNRQLVRWDISAMRGSLVGQSEKNTREATKIIDGLGECVVLLDEFEKAVGGAVSSARTDGGTTSSMIGHVLTWMQESDSSKFFVATCNNIFEILAISQGAFMRRFDDVFFLDLPNASERADIFKIMEARYGYEFEKSWVSETENWTGAEIEKFVRSTLYEGEQKAFEGIKPVFLQAQDEIEKTRHWAKLNARNASIVENVDDESSQRVFIGS
jgi:ATP-dependent 26S proteasome regulatory subunit